MLINNEKEEEMKTAMAVIKETVKMYTKGEHTVIFYTHHGIYHTEFDSFEDAIVCAKKYNAVLIGPWYRPINFAKDNNKYYKEEK
jgi:hypothetical protein